MQPCVGVFCVGLCRRLVCYILMSLNVERDIHGRLQARGQGQTA